MAGLFPAPMKIIQSRGLSLFLYESTNGFRQIFTDGRTLPKDPVPAWQGYSIGHWERDTFVVESNGFNDRTWLDGIGHPHGEKLHITERYSRRDFGHMDLELTIDDPDWYERPWSVKVLFNLTPADELIENVCLENERDAEHMK
jgi:hypothetical protein